MSFQFGCARSLYGQGVHPRVLIGPQELAAIQRRARSGRGRQIMDSLRARLRPQMREILDAGDDAKALAVLEGGYFGKTVWWNLDEIAMVGRIDDDQEAVEAARRVLAGIARANSDASGNTCHVPHAYDVLHDLLPESDRALIRNWLYERGVRELLSSLGRFYLGAGGNKSVCTLISALLNLLALRGDAGVPDLKPEQDKLVLMLEAALHATHGPDGYPTEDIGYGTSMSAYLAFAVEAVRRAGLYDAYAQCPRFARFGQAMLHFVQPGGEHLTTTGDNHDVFYMRQLVLARAAAATRDKTLLWLLGTLRVPNDRWFSEVEIGNGCRVPCSWVTLALLDDLRAPIHPAKAKTPTQFRDRGRGIASFRSGWDPDATYVVFDGSQRSPACQGHDHDSCGHFSISALGEHFAIDTGRYNVDQDQHNLVLVDGRSGRPTDGLWQASSRHGVLIDYRPGEFCDFAAADSSHQHNCYWARRHLGLVKGAGAPAYVWTVEDINKANDWAEFSWTLNTCPGNRIKLFKSHATIEGRAQGNMLDVHFALPDPKAYPKPHTLSMSQDVVRVGSPKYMSDKEVYERLAEFRGREHEMIHGRLWQRPRLIAKVGGYNGRFMSLMIPRRQGDKPAKVERLPSLDNSLAVRIAFADVEDTLIWAYEHHLLEAGGVSARGQWVVVRRARSSGKLRSFASADLTRLSVDGKTISTRTP